MALRVNQVRPALLIFILILLTAVPRLIVLERSLAGHISVDDGHIIYDGYVGLAKSMLSHGVYAIDGVHPITTRAPLLPILLIPGLAMNLPILWLFGLQFVLSIAAVLILYLAARSFGASSWASFLAAAFFALDPWFMLLGRYASTSIVAVFLISSLLLCLARERYLLLGLCGGLLAICHPSCAFALPAALLAIAIRKRWQSILRPAVVALAVYALVLSPWIVRNYELTGKIKPGIDGFGYQYLNGSSLLEANRTHKPAVKPALPPGHEKADYAVVDSVANAYCDQLARKDLSDTLLHHPGRLLNRLGHQFVWFWAAEKREPSTRSTIKHLLYLLPFFVGALISIALRWRSVGVLILIAVPTMLIHSLVLSFAFEAMYSLPVIPVLVVLTAAAADVVFRAIGNRKVFRHLPAIAVPNATQVAG